MRPGHPQNKNAFNTIPWDRIDATAAGMGIPLYARCLIIPYLSERYILISSDSELVEWRMRCDVLQGSIFRPTLWNIFYDGLFRLQLPNGASLVGFANDFGLVVVNNTTDELEVALYESQAKIDSWIQKH